MAADRNTIIKEAQKFAGKGQFDKAIAEWRKLVKESPDDPNLYNTIGDLCLKKNAKSEAVDAYRRAADLLARDGFTSKAIALYKKVLNIDPSMIEVHLALGDMNAEKGLTGNALENYKHVADHYNKQNKKAEALRIYQKMADLNPANVGFRVKLAGMYVKEGMKAEAVTAYLAAADAHIEKTEYQDARKMFEKVLEIDPENKTVYHKAGIVYYQEGKLDEARKSLKRAFEADPGNEELMNLYLEVLEKAGRGGDAEEIYRKLLSLDSTRFDLHEKIYSVLLDKKDYDKALTEAVAIAEHKAESMDFIGAAGVMQNLIAVTHDPLAAAAALGDLFGKHGRAQEGAKEMVVAAEALVERGSTDDAREVLNRALILAPGFDAAVGRLAELEGAGAAPAGIPSAAPGPEPEPGGGMFAVELESPALEEEAPPPPPPHREEPAVREDPAVASALSEVEVLIKYGLVPKAIEQLEGVVQRFPGVSRVRARLLELYRDQKLTDKAVIQALMLAEIYEQQGQQDESRSVLRSALELAPGNLQIMAKLGMAAPEPESVETIEEPEAIEEIAEIPEVPEEIPELAVPELDMEMPSEVSELEMAEEPEETAGIGFEEEAPVEAPAAGPARGRRYEPPREEKVFEEEAPLEEAFPETEPLADTEVSELWAEAEFYYQQGLFDEARKCYERVLEQRPNDQKAMGRIVEITREKEDVAEFTRLSEEVKSLERMIQAGPGEVEESVSQTDVDAVRSLMQEITDLRKGPSAPPKQPAREREPAAAQEDFTEQSFAGITEESEDLPSGEKQAAEDSFADLSEELSGREPTAPFSGDGNTVEGRPSSDESADFFDLAAELRDELSTTTASTPSPSLHEQSIDEIFEEFKAGVEAHEKKEDEDTHYNLGVAYREMGLLDDAISEFNMTNEGEPKFIQSRYMLGLCYLENGDYETAILEIQNALGYSYSFGEASDERISMHYDLGLAYQGIGNTQSALEELQKVHAIDPSYREVSTKIKELEEGEFISLDAIKEDIEKEISFKFLEEGARIEREEKTKPKKTKK